MRLPGGETGRAANIIQQKDQKNTGHDAVFGPADAFDTGMMGRKRPQDEEMRSLHAATVTFVAQLDGDAHE